MIGSEYPYALSVVLLGIPWAWVFVERKDLRSEMFTAGILGSLAALTNVWYIPEYWNPRFVFSVFRFSGKFAVGISVEDVLFGFFLAGFAAACYEFLFRAKLGKKVTHRQHWIAFAIFVFLFVGLEFIFPSATIYNHILALCAGAIAVWVQRPDLVKKSLWAGGIVTSVYMIHYAVIEFVTGSVLVSARYNTFGLSGLQVGPVPIEEILFPFAVGLFGSVVYEYLMGIRLRSQKART